MKSITILKIKAQLLYFGRFETTKSKFKKVSSSRPEHLSLKKSSLVVGKGATVLV